MYASFEVTAHCVAPAQQRQDWKSRSLVDLQPQRPPRQNQSKHHQPQETASIFSNNLRSNSWRNLSLIGKNDSNQGATFLCLFNN